MQETINEFAERLRGFGIAKLRVDTYNTDNIISLCLFEYADYKKYRDYCGGVYIHSDGSITDKHGEAMHIKSEALYCRDVDELKIKLRDALGF